MKQQRIQTWLADIADEELRTLALTRMSPITQDMLVVSLHRALSGGILYASTPEGSRFWELIERQAEMGNIQLASDKVYTLKDLYQAHAAGRNDLPIDSIAKITKHVNPTNGKDVQ